MRAGAASLLFVLLAACPDEPCADGSCPADAAPAEDARVPDAQADAEPDAAPTFPDAEPAMDRAPVPDSGVRFSEVSCADCASGCAATQCLRAGSESFCADRCDDDPAACTFGFACLDLDPDPNASAYFCVPPSASCRAPGVGFGASCYGSGESCLMAVSDCEGDQYALGFCTIPCGSSFDCPAGWACQAGDFYDVCQPRFASAPERCARDHGSVQEAPCEIDADCPSGVCVRSEQSLPGVCAESCAGGCAPGTQCRPTARGERCLTAQCACHALGSPGARDLFTECLASVELTPCGTTFSVFDWAQVPNDIRSDEFRLSFFDAVHNAPLTAPAYAAGLVATLDGARRPDPVASAALLVEELARRLDQPAVRHPPGAPDPLEPLATAVAELVRATGGAPDEAALRADAAGLPLDLQLALAGVVDAVRRAALARRTALDDRFPQAVSGLYDYGPAFVARRADGFGLSPANANNRLLLNGGFRYGEVFGAAVDVLEAAAAADLGRFARVPTTTVATSTATLLFAADTPVGRVAVGDGESGIYDDRVSATAAPWALLVDLGGNDRYRTAVAGNVRADNSVSVFIDLAGDDEYGYVPVPHPQDGRRLVADAGGRAPPAPTPMEGDGPVSLSETPRQGGARLGTAVHLDLGSGRDHYQSLRLSQGSGAFGAGVLVDDGGDDVYLAETVSQGAGAFGLGLLYDAGGDDERRAYTMAQGFGFARGAGLAFDVAGDDQWLLDPGDPALGGDPLYFNAQRPGLANSSLGQGFAFGRRADTTDRVFMSGGLGLLLDRDGADRYQGSIFAQGGGFWFGTGVLADFAGADHYDALWYGMGSGAHYALGFLFEGGGDDVYGANLPGINVTLAGGHDYSAAFLIDEGGDDHYLGSRLTLGAGNANGMGFFADNAGDDRYQANSLYSMGAGGLLGAELSSPGNPRRLVDSVGVFLEAGGRDQYLRAGMTPADLKDDAAWTQTQNPDPQVSQLERGCGVDGSGESGLHFRP